MAQSSAGLSGAFTVDFVLLCGLHALQELIEKWWENNGPRYSCRIICGQRQ